MYAIPANKDDRRGVNAMAKDYAGRISNGGAQVVKAPCRTAEKKSGGRVVRGGDLRDGRKKEQKDK